MKLLLIFDMFQINNKTRFNMKRKKNNNSKFLSNNSTCYIIYEFCI